MSLSPSYKQVSLRVQITQIDHTLIQPGPLDNSSFPRVPVIRIYGASSAGKKACLHVHQVYPYFFVEYSGTLTFNYVNRYIFRLTKSLNHAIALSLKRNPLSPEADYIRSILLVKGVHFYGFHASYTPFLKVFMIDPGLVARAAAILQSGTVMGTRFCIFESHLSYTLQFMCDFGLYGCGWIDLEDVVQRDVQSTYGEEFASPDSTGRKFNLSPYYRQTRMPLEVDAIAPHILNRHNISARNLHHTLEIPAPPLPTEPLVLSVRELWEDERQRRVARGLNPSPEIPLDPSDSHRGPGGDWVAEAEWWEELRQKLERDREAKRSVQPSTTEWENWVMTAFESVEALWEELYRSWRPTNSRHTEAISKTSKTASCIQESQWDAPDEATELEDNSDAIDVNISILSSQELSQLIELEEAGWAQYGDEDRGPEEDVDPTMVEELDAISEEDDPVGSQEMADFDQIDFRDPFELPHGSDDTPMPMPMKELEFKLSTPPDRPRAEPELPSPTTPTRAGPNLKPLWLSDSDSEDAPDPAAARRPSQSESRTGIVHDDLVRMPTRTSNNSLKHCSPPLQPFEPTRCEPSPEMYPAIASTDTPRLAKRRKLSFPLQNDEIPSGNFFSSPSPFTGPSQQPPAVTVKLLRESYAVRSVKALNANRYDYAMAPPSASDLLDSLNDYDIPSRIYCAPYYSMASDVPERAREYAGLLFHLKGGDGIAHLDTWVDSVQVDVQPGRPSPLLSTGIGGWEYASAPPSVMEVKRWLARDGRASTIAPYKMKSQIEGPTQANVYGLKETPGPKRAPQLVPREPRTMSILAMEVFVPTQEGKALNTKTDEIAAIFYAYQTSTADSPKKGIIVVQASPFDHRNIHDIRLDLVQNEIDLINRIVDLVGDFDPDIVTGWDVQKGSWGYLDTRGQQHGFEITDLISRAPATHSTGNDQWGLHRTSTFKVAGRHVLNLWRIMRSEHTLTSYTLENVAFHVLHKRVPCYSNATLSEWYYSGVPFHAAKALRYFSDRTSMLSDILEKSDVITKTAEFARVFGVDFFSVISRGSQFKVESFMFRIAKPENFVLISPSRRDVGKQNAAECMPLIMEPASAFYSSPLVVLDFQSLYPSIMIAYNYCYSTCLGRVKDFQGCNKFGVVDLELPPGLLASLSDHIHVAPNGIIYVKPEVRKGLLGRMLIELLGTRVMVKQAMRGVENKALRRILDARQLGLKYIANVTYGYTSATYSGRMPAVEIADSIVQSGRETLEKAIKSINSTKKWGAQVVYGDTDSVFIYLRGKTKEQAFRIGQDIADTVTALNPSPIKLKFEKVYFPCVLLAKKRYVGFKFERIDDMDPVFEAKGIETVRRDGVFAQQKMTESCLKILFRTQDLSEVKDFCCRSWTKLLENKASLQDFIFAKEVRMGTYSKKGPPPPGVVVAAKRMMEDPMNEPQYGERVPYVIVRGPRGSRLVDRAMDPLEMLEDSHLQLDAMYYISRVLIPPLERIFNLVGADVRGWFNEMPKAHYLDPTSSPMKVKEEVGSSDRLHIEEHFRSSQCLICGSLASQGLCDECYFSPQETTAKLSSRIQANERRLLNAHRICTTCIGSAPGEPIQCESIDCPWFFSRKRAENKEDCLTNVKEILNNVNENAKADTDDDPTTESDDGDDYMDLMFRTPES